MSSTQDWRDASGKIAEEQIEVHIGQDVQRLSLHWHGPDGRPGLTDAAGTWFQPWEVELLRWPSAAEAALRRGGYLPGPPDAAELWCNCAD